MILANFPKFRKYKGQDVIFLQPKFDGHLAKINKLGSNVEVYTKNDHNITDKLFAIDHIRKTLEALPCVSQVFAEMHNPNKFATDVPTMLNNADENLRLTAFAVPWLGGVDMSKVVLTGAMDSLKALGFEAAETEYIPEHCISDARQKELLAKAAELKLEGWVLKAGHMSGWYKLKPVDDLDAFIIGTKMSTSPSYWGELKSVVVGVWQTDANGNRSVYVLGDVPGFSDDARAYYNTASRRKELIDRVIRVEYSGIAGDGKMRWPHFAGWRNDKNKDDCTISQLE